MLFVMAHEAFRVSASGLSIRGFFDYIDGQAAVGQAAARIEDQAQFDPSDRCTPTAYPLSVSSRLLDL